MMMMMIRRRNKNRKCETEHGSAKCQFCNTEAEQSNLEHLPHNGKLFTEMSNSLTMWDDGNLRTTSSHYCETGNSSLQASTNLCLGDTWSIQVHYSTRESFIGTCPSIQKGGLAVCPRGGDRSNSSLDLSIDGPCNNFWCTRKAAYLGIQLSLVG